MKMRQKCVPSARNSTLGTPTSVENATPSSKSASKMRPLVQKLRVWMPYRKLWGAFRGAENRTPEHEIASKMRPLKQKVGVEMAKMAFKCPEMSRIGILSPRRAGFA